MSSLNKAMIIGYLGDNPEIRQTKGGKKVANISLATSSKYKDKNGEWTTNTEWHNIVVWGNLVDICDKYLHKGSKIYCEGPLQTNTWEDKNGNTRHTTYINMLNMIMLDDKQQSSVPSNNSSKQTTSTGIGSQTDLSNFDNIDDDLPF